MNIINSDCPFCGAGRDSLHVEYDSGLAWPYGKAWVECANCGARGPHIISYGVPANDFWEAAIDAWNNQQPANIRPTKT